MKKNIPYQDCLNEDSRRVSITYKDAQGNDSSRRTTIAGKKRGRKKLPIPSENILTAYDKQVLSSPYPTLEKFKVYEKLLKACGNSLTALKRFLDTYYPIASKDRKTLRNYIKSYSLTKDAIEFVLQRHNNNPLVSKEELEQLVYCYIKTKLRRIVQTEGTELTGFSETYTSREQEVK